MLLDAFVKTQNLEEARKLVDKEYEIIKQQRLKEQQQQRSSQNQKNVQNTNLPKQELSNPYLKNYAEDVGRENAKIIQNQRGIASVPQVVPNGSVQGQVLQNQHNSAINTNSQVANKPPAPSQNIGNQNTNQIRGQTHGAASSNSAGSQQPHNLNNNRNGNSQQAVQAQPIQNRNVQSQPVRNQVVQNIQNKQIQNRNSNQKYQAVKSQNHQQRIPAQANPKKVTPVQNQKKQAQQ